MCHIGLWRGEAAPPLRTPGCRPRPSGAPDDGWRFGFVADHLHRAAVVARRDGAVVLVRGERDLRRCGPAPSRTLWSSLPRQRRQTGARCGHARGLSVRTGGAALTRGPARRGWISPELRGDSKERIRRLFGHRAGSVLFSTKHAPVRPRPGCRFRGQRSTSARAYGLRLPSSTQVGGRWAIRQRVSPTYGPTSTDLRTGWQSERERPR